MSAFVPTNALLVVPGASFCAPRSRTTASRRPSSLSAARSASRRAIWRASGDASSEKSETPSASTPAPASSEESTTTSAAAAEEVAEEVAEEEEEEIVEPYPGFLADMKRMGSSDAEARAQAAKMAKQSKGRRVDGSNNMLRPDGTSYAPWMGEMPTFDAKVIKRRTDATGRLAADPQQGELSGLGMQWRMLGDELELSWATGGEEGNVGFAVYRRKGKDTEWVKVSDYRDKPAELATQGPQGGKYSFLVPDPEPGTWVYRISDVDGNNNVSDLSQVLVEIESAEDSRVQKIALAALLALLALAFAAGIALDPLSSA